LDFRIFSVVEPFRLRRGGHVALRWRLVELRQEFPRRRWCVILERHRNGVSDPRLAWDASLQSVAGARDGARRSPAICQPPALRDGRQQAADNAANHKRDKQDHPDFCEMLDHVLVGPR